MTPLLKVCGITNLVDARLCAAAGVDYLGFVMHPPSPRNVSPGLVRDVSEWLSGVETVGVFVDTNPGIVNELAADCGFSLVQLHGDESPADCSLLDVPVIKAIRITPQMTTNDISRLAAPYAGIVDYFLFDTWSKSAHGGTGLAFDWRVLRDYDTPTPYFVAGGITAGNVAEAVATARPHGVDVSSSLESAPGQKDIDKLNLFIEAFRAASA